MLDYVTCFLVGGVVLCLAFSVSVQGVWQRESGGFPGRKTDTSDDGG